MRVKEELSVDHPKEYPVKPQKPGVKWIRKKKEKPYD
jgi:hypothetical protein